MHDQNDINILKNEKDFIKNLKKNLILKTSVFLFMTIQ